MRSAGFIRFPTGAAALTMRSVLSEKDIAAIPVRFPSEEDPGDAGWHIDSGYAAPDQSRRANVRACASSSRLAGKQ